MDWKTIEMLANLSKGNKGELLLELVTNFIEETQENIPLLKECLEAEKRREVEMLAHKLKGSGFTIGASGFAHSAADIEVNARDNNLEKISPQIAILIDKFDYSKAEFIKYLQTLGKEI